MVRAAAASFGADFCFPLLPNTEQAQWDGRKSSGLSEYLMGFMRAPLTLA